MIHIVGDYYLDADKYQYIVGQKYMANEKDKKTGETKQIPRLKDPLSFRTVADALDDTIQKAVRDKIEKDKLHSIREVYDEIVKLNCELAKRFGKEELMFSKEQVANAPERPRKAAEAKKK